MEYCSCGTAKAFNTMTAKKKIANKTKQNKKTKKYQVGNILNNSKYLRCMKNTTV